MLLGHIQAQQATDGENFSWPCFDQNKLPSLQWLRSGHARVYEFFDLPGGKCVSLRILDMNNVEGSRMPFTVDYSANSPQVTTSSNHAQVTCIKKGKKGKS